MLPASQKPLALLQKPGLLNLSQGRKDEWVNLQLLHRHCHFFGKDCW
ncbi:HNH endonuclease [Ancylothrix sp. D3o]